MSDSMEGEALFEGAIVSVSAGCPAERGLEPAEAERFALAFVPMWQHEADPFPPEARPAQEPQAAKADAAITNADSLLPVVLLSEMPPEPAPAQAAETEIVPKQSGGGALMAVAACIALLALVVAVRLSRVGEPAPVVATAAPTSAAAAPYAATEETNIPPPPPVAEDPPPENTAVATVPQPSAVRHSLPTAERDPASAPPSHETRSAHTTRGPETSQPPRDPPPSPSSSTQGVGDVIVRDNPF
jgi:hypothetical protein